MSCMQFQSLLLGCLGTVGAAPTPYLGLPMLLCRFFTQAGDQGDLRAKLQAVFEMHAPQAVKVQFVLVAGCHKETTSLITQVPADRFLLQWPCQSCLQPMHL